MKHAALVIRVSDSRQETSPENQRNQLRSYIDLFFNSETDENDEKIAKVEVYKEYELFGVSGKDSFDSNEFKELKDDIRRKNIDIVLATGLDRLGRNVVKFLEFFELLRRNDVDLIVTQYQIDTTGPIGVLVITILMALAEMQREQYSLKQKGTQHERFKKGRRTGGTIPLGFDRHPTEIGLYIENKKESPIVRFLFTKYLEDKNLSAVARAANRQGYRSKVHEGKKGIRGGKTFNGTTVRNILENWIYIGVLEEHKRNKGKPDSEVPEDQRYSRRTDMSNPDEWPHLVEDEVFHAVQDLLTQEGSGKPSVQRTYSYVLSGIVHCALCDGMMVVEKGGKHRYYACQNKECSGKKLIPKKFYRRKRNTINAPILDDAVKRLIKDVILTSPKDIHDITRQANEYLNNSIPLLTEQIRSLVSRKESLLSEKRGVLIALSVQEEDRAVSKSLAEDLNVILKDIEEIELSISRLTSERDQANEQRVTEAAVKRALEVLVMSMTGIPDETQKELVQMFFESVRVGVEEIEAHIRLDNVLYLARVGPDPDKFDWSEAWYARQDLNPEPSGP